MRHHLISNLCKLSLTSAGLFLASLVFTNTARADLRICNDTSSLVGVAIGYRNDGEWVSEGWFQVQGNSCNAVIEGTLNSRFYYIYAEDSSQGGQWRGDIFLCTDDVEFKIDGVKDCFKRGYMRSGFFEIDTGNQANWLVRLTEQSRSSP